MKKAILGSAIFVGLYNIFFYPTVLGIGISILFFLLNAYLFTVRDRDTKNLPLAMLISGLSIFLCLMAAVRANMHIQAIDLIASLFLSIAAGFLYKKQKPFNSSIFSFITIPFSAIAEGFASINQFFSRNKTKIYDKNHADTYNIIFQGVLIAIPIILVLFFVLLDADPIFKTLAGKISFFSISNQMIVSVIIFLTCFFWGLATVKDKIINQNKEPKTNHESFAIRSLIITTATASLFAIFLLIQLRFLFLHVPETELKNLGINIQTYSEYVRQGFFNLLIAAVISASVIAFILQKLHSILTKHNIYLKISMIILTSETLLLLLSAGKRLYLYELAHGLTRSRIYGAVFLFWLSLLLLIFIAATLKKVKSSHFFIATASVTLFSFLIINAISVDSLIANKYPPTINHEIDNVYISWLSPEAASTWPDIIKNAEISLQKFEAVKEPTDEDKRKVINLRAVLSRVVRHVNYLQQEKKWQAFNFSEYNARVIIQNNLSLFKNLEALTQRVFQKQTDWLSISPTPTPHPTFMNEVN